MAKLPDESFPKATSGEGIVWKTLLSGSKTATDTFTCGIATCAPKSGSLNAHRHRQAELYHFIEGDGIVEIDGNQHAVQPGAVVFVPSGAEHSVKNSSTTNELKWLYVFAVDDFSQVMYRWPSDSNYLDNSILKSKL